MLETLNENFAKLVSLYEGEKHRADELSEKLSESESKVKAYSEQITELNRQVDNLKLSSAFASGADNTEAKERIDKLIHEIDKCISFLED